MNQKILSRIVENKDAFVPYIISEKQFLVMEKVVEKKKLTRTEYNYLCNGIKKKLFALGILVEEKPELYLYNPDGMIPQRRQEAINMLSQTNRAFISGSFLFSKEYNDIDVFIISNRHREEHKGTFHFIYLKEQDLAKPTFQSAAMSCISNFYISLPGQKIRKLHLAETLSTYQESIISVLEGEDLKDLKDIIFSYSLHNMKKILSSFELNKEYERIKKRQDKIELISTMAKELILTNFNKDYIIIKLNEYITTLDDDIKNIKPNDHLKIYKKNYEDMIHECRRIKGQAYRNIREQHNVQ